MDAARRTFFFAAVLAVPLGVIGCASLAGRTLTLSPGDLERLMARRFPLDRRVLDLFDLSLQTPRLQLLPERNRIAADLELRATERLFAGRWRGRLKFDAQLRWEPSDQSLRLAQVRVHDLALENPDAASRSGAERLGGALVERVLEDLSIYQMPLERWHDLQRQGVLPGPVQITPRGVEVTFEPVAR